MALARNFQLEANLFRSLAFLGSPKSSGLNKLTNLRNIYNLPVSKNLSNSCFLARTSLILSIQSKEFATFLVKRNEKSRILNSYLSLLSNPRRGYHEIEESNREAIPKTIKYQIPHPKFAQNWRHMKRHQMKKHQRTKWRKKFAAFIRATKLRRNIKKERAFRAEILGRVLEAEKFEAKKYVESMLTVIDEAPKEEGRNEEALIKVFKLIRQYRYETTLVTPFFDDPVPRKKYDKMYKSK